MTGQLAIFCCRNFAREFSAGVTALGYRDVAVIPFPARCGRPPLAWDQLRSLLPTECSQVILLGRSCLHGLGNPPADFPPTRQVSIDQCFQLVAGETLVNESLRQGAYLLTPAWLAEWRTQLRAMGFDPESGNDLFKEIARKLLLLDTGIEAETQKHWSELQAAIKLPAERIPVGLDHVRLVLQELILTWRLDRQRNASDEASRRHASEIADHVAATDMLQRLAKTQTETDAIQAIEELFHMLFAPAELHYLRVENGMMTSATDIPEAQLDELRQLDETRAWRNNEQGFLLRISHANETLGLVSVAKLTYPQYRMRYLNMALAISGICGLAIANARNRKRLLEAEKMASLGMLVAGVAHEINTPLGVSLAASSTIQTQSRELDKRFAGRSMTQSDLRHYLDVVATSTSLLSQNLARIGQLIDDFRQVAVDRKSLSSTHFCLRKQLDDAIRSLGDRLDPKRIDLCIDCDPNLEIDSQPGDWASIFINLLSNSITHGFRDRERGRIEISISASSKSIDVDYRDDGVGFSSEVQARIFDPFFTTDLQHGMGLGMHLVYNLITHRLGGSINCESHPGKGAHFHIEMPLESAS